MPEMWLSNDLQKIERELVLQPELAACLPLHTHPTDVSEGPTLCQVL